MDRPRLHPPISARGMVLGLAAAVQLLLLTRTTLQPMGSDIWAVRASPARQRAARLAFGGSFADFIQFLNDEIPEDAMVVLPPSEHDPTLGHLGLMQFLLFPRPLTNCPRMRDWGTCKLNYYGDRTYVISVRGFPPRDEPFSSKRYVGFDDRRGLFVPDVGHPGEPLDGE